MKSLTNIILKNTKRKDRKETKKEIILSRIMLAIPMIVYGILTNAGIMFYTYMIIILLILPIIPIMITSLIISVILRFTNKIKNKNKAMYIII